MENRYIQHTQGSTGPMGVETGTVPWNELVRVAIMLRQWRLVDSHEALWPLLAQFRQWHGQRRYRYDGTLMDQLLAQWPVQDTVPRIWASCHIGPYGLITRALLQQGMGVAVLLKDEIFHEQYPVYLDAFIQFFGRAPKDTELRFIRSGGRECLIQLKRALEEGLHVLAYIDSDEGGDSAKSRIEISVHRQPLTVRYGIAVLAQWTGVPIRPLMLSIQGNKLVVDTDRDYLVQGREDYQRLMQALFRLPERLDPRTLMQWEMLPHLVDQFPPKVQTQQEGGTWMIPVEHLERTLLLDIGSLRITEIPATLHREWRDQLEQYVCP